MRKLWPAPHDYSNARIVLAAAGIFLVGGRPCINCQLFTAEHTKGSLQKGAGEQKEQNSISIILSFTKQTRQTMDFARFFNMFLGLPTCDTGTPILDL